MNSQRQTTGAAPTIPEPTTGDTLNKYDYLTWCSKCHAYTYHNTAGCAECYKRLIIIKEKEDE